MKSSPLDIPAPPDAVCVHCGDPVRGDGLEHEGMLFCCNGCKVVHGILSQANNCPVPPPRPATDRRFSYLDEPSVVERVRDFSDGNVSAVTFVVPQMHCSSCVWLLENLYRFDAGIVFSRVDFLKKSITIRFAEEKTTLRKVVELLSTLGYEPRISLDAVAEKSEPATDRSLYAKIGIAGFCFGNIMILSFPEYLSGGEVDPPLRTLFTAVSLVLALPVLFYSSTGYFRSAVSGLVRRVVNIDVPIALGILILFIRSAVEILGGMGTGYLDSMTGLVFFLLIGRLFQNTTYDSLNFERTYTSYFPLAVTVRAGGGESTVPVTSLQPGDRVVIRNNEIIPADAVLIDGDASIDYSFVTGESRTVPASPGDRVHAGGRQVGSALELAVIKSVSQSYLTQLWNDAAFHSEPSGNLGRLSNIVGKYFTAGILAVAAAAGLFWVIEDPSRAPDAVTAVLIVACPCALALATPFAFGTAVRVYGRAKLYTKNTDVVEAMTRVTTVVFDKTGTLTRAGAQAVRFVGRPLSAEEMALVRSLVRNSHHPLSRAVYDALAPAQVAPVADFRERANAGVEGVVSGRTVRVGSRVFTGSLELRPTEEVDVVDGGAGSRVYVSIDGSPRGSFHLHGEYREGIGDLVGRLREAYDVVVLSGDTDRERTHLEARLGTGVPMVFEQAPADKLAFIVGLQEQGKRVLMVGDGLNDAGALRQADVGIALTDDTAAFTPACDAILDGSRLGWLDRFLSFAWTSRLIVMLAYGISIVYNGAGLWFAVRGELAPVIAAILMPLSSVTVVAFTSLTVQALARRKGLL